MEFNATFIVSAISFIIFVFIMNMIFYSPLEKIITKREKLVEDTLNEAKVTEEKAEQILADREKRLQDAAIKGKKIVSDKVQSATIQAQEDTSFAKKTSVKSIEEQKQQLDEQNKNTKEILNSRIDYLADIIVKKVIK